MAYAPTREIMEAAYQHAEACAPLESCGAIAGGGYHRLTNRTDLPDRFVMDMPGFIALSRSNPVTAIVHSHVDQPAVASPLDLVNCERIRLPFVILGWPAGDVSVVEPTCSHEPLVGRQWEFGRHDCFSLVRDALAEHAGIDIPDFAREWNFWQRGENLIEDGFANAGFDRLPKGSEPRQLDVFAFRIRSPLPNHLAIFLAPDLMLHHAEHHLSMRELYSPAWQRLTAAHYRHEAMR